MGILIVVMPIFITAVIGFMWGWPEPGTVPLDKRDPHDEYAPDGTLLGSKDGGYRHYHSVYDPDDPKTKIKCGSF